MRQTGFVVVVSLWLLGGTALAQTSYDSQAYGDCVYGGTTDCSSGSGTTTLTPAPTPTSIGTPAAPTVIILNNDPLYGGTGVLLHLNASNNPILPEFYTINSDGSANSGQVYKITVASIGDNFVVLNFTPISSDNAQPIVETISLQQTQTSDVNGDGVADITVTLQSIQDGTAGLLFQLPSAPKPTTGGGPITKPSINSSQPAGQGVLGGVLSALDHIIKNVIQSIPQPILVTFPYTLLLLLLLIAIWTIRQSWLEIIYYRKLAHLLKLQRQIVEEKDNFLNLSAHYLRTPLTNIAGGVDLLGIKPETHGLGEKLKPVVQQLREIIERILQQAGSSQQLQDIDIPESITQEALKVRLETRLVILVVIIGAVVLATDFLVHQAKHLSDDTLNYILQLTLYVLISLAVYGSLRYWRLRRKNSLETLRLLNSQLALDRGRNDLIAGVYHEASPLVETLSNAEPELPEGEVASRAMVNGFKNFRDILGKFALLPTLSALNPTLANQDCDVGEVIRQAVEPYQAAIAAKKQTITLPIATTPLPVHGEIGLVRRVVISLIDNAVKFTPEGGKIEVEARQQGGKVRLWIRDNGPGIAPDKLPHIFKPFSRAEIDALHFNLEGMGFSLYLDKIILDALEGSIAVSSPAGAGITFEVVLNAPEQTQAAAILEAQPSLDGGQINLLVARS